MANQLQIKKALHKPYDRNLFAKDVLSPVFGANLTIKTTPVSASIQPNKTENKAIDKVDIYGEIELEDGTQITCYEILLQPKVRIEQSKIAIQRYARKLLTAGQATLINFVSPSNKNTWRLTFIAKDSVLTDEGIKEKATNAKRYTYLLGKTESCKTAAERFEILSAEPSLTMETMIKAFSVEKLSKAFFDEYLQHYNNFVNYLTNSNFKSSVFNGDDKAIRDFTKKLLGRIVFLYFVQKKGWLGATTIEYKDGLNNFVMQYFKLSGGNEAFYENFLKTLFFETLNEQREKDDFEMPNGKILKIPYLNGGLFDKGKFDNGLLTFKSDLFHNVLNEEDPKYRGFLDFLNAYNFTVYEDSPDEQFVAVDPEVLGHIFENLLEDNKDKGAYYTPKEIVHYMCQESLTEYLNTNLTGFKNLSGLRTNIVQFIKYKQENDFIKQNAKAINTALDNVKICDPAIGSGAFPMGLLQEIFALKEVIAYETSEEWKPAQVKEDIIQNSIYGVDIEKGAVDIARLRFWLSLVVDEEKPKALPNLDYKIVVGNSLVPMFEDDIIEIDWSSDTTKEGFYGQEFAIKRIKLLNNLTSKQKKYFHSENIDKKKLNLEIRNIKIDILVNQLELMVKTKGLDSYPTGIGRKLKEQIILYENTIIWKTNITKLKALKQLPDKPLNHFDWKLDFAKILNAKINKNAGFDIVIGNPPYVRADNPQFAEMRKQIMNSGNYETLWEKWDLMVPFIEKGLKLLNPNGNFSFIVSNSITTSKFAYKLQDWIIENYQLKSIDYFENIKVFDAGVIPVVLSITTDTKNNILPKKILRSGSFENKEVTEINIDNTNPEAIRSTLFKKRYNQAFNPEIKTVRLGDICYLSYGLRPNSDERFWKGEFSRNDIISEIKIGDFIKKYVEGKDIKEYKIEKIKYLEWNTERVPAKLVRPTFPALYKGDKILRGRVTKGTFDNTGIVCNDSIVVMKRFTDLKKVNKRSITSSISKNNLSEADKKKKGKAKKTAVLQRRREIEELSENYSLKYILAVINSKYAMAYLNNFRRHRFENYFYPDDFRNYPISVASQEQQKTLEILVDYLLYLNKDEISHLPQSENILTSYFEQIINGCVYELYFPEVLKKHNHEVFKHLTNLIPIDIEGGFLEIETIAEIFNTLYKPDHSLRKSLYYMDSITEIRIVEGVCIK